MLHTYLFAHDTVTPILLGSMSSVITFNSIFSFSMLLAFVRTHLSQALYMFPCLLVEPLSSCGLWYFFDNPLHVPFKYCKLCGSSRSCYSAGSNIRWTWFWSCCSDTNTYPCRSPQSNTGCLRLHHFQQTSLPSERIENNGRYEQKKKIISLPPPHGTWLAYGYHSVPPPPH